MIIFIIEINILDSLFVCLKNWRYFFSQKKLLLQCSVRELNNNLYRSKVRLPHLVLMDGKKLVSVTSHYVQEDFTKGVMSFEQTFETKCVTTVCYGNPLCFESIQKGSWMERASKWIYKSTVSCHRTSQEQVFVVQKRNFCCLWYRSSSYSQRSCSLYSMWPTSWFWEFRFSMLKCASGKCNDCPDYIRPFYFWMYYFQKNQVLCLYIRNFQTLVQKCTALSSRTKIYPLCDTKNSKNRKGEIGDKNTLYHWGWRLSKVLGASKLSWKTI